MDVDKCIDALLKGENPGAHFSQICDERLSIFNGILDYNGDEFFLINGKNGTRLYPFSENPEYSEEDHFGQVRTFRMQGTSSEGKIADFKTWYDLEAFQEFYGDLVPPKIAEQLQEMMIKGLNNF